MLLMLQKTFLVRRMSFFYPLAELRRIYILFYCYTSTPLFYVLICSIKHSIMIFRRNIVYFTMYCLHCVLNQGKTCCLTGTLSHIFSEYSVYCVYWFTEVYIVVLLYIYTVRYTLQCIMICSMKLISYNLTFHPSNTFSFSLALEHICKRKLPKGNKG